ncbi:CRISPR-associated protein [Vulcanisaeta distributa]|uniref:CRISPR-associated protein, APE2256 family n=1 Tax=Vulcanisaeta distributa (strain DSM 14429 / JCM 11212 / NBRC 100878 / IC-017) TaxID=572478 RepID=E1QQX6_VULDI|nr:CRISPR-associated protein [Vulcanisaeta distributa]ADN50546.1 CRISPR-associated protein, APE2256 family [Vulcanisaeta distributa DSM 14429]
MPAFLGVIVGLSLLENALVSSVVGDELVRRVLGGDREADSRLSRYLYNEGFINRLRDFACGDLVRCCAEGSSVVLLRRLLGGDVIRVKFYATDTASSQLCTVALVRCLTSKSRELGVEVDGYTRVQFFGTENFSDGLGNLVRALGSDLIDYISRGFDAYVSIAGGTKLESVMASMVAWLLGAKPIYVTVDGRLIVLPRMPLRVDDELVSKVLSGALGGLPRDLLSDLVRSGFLVRRGDSVELAPWFREFLNLTRRGTPGA